MFSPIFEEVRVRLHLTKYWYLHLQKGYQLPSGLMDGEGKIMAEGVLIGASNSYMVTFMCV